MTVSFDRAHWHSHCEGFRVDTANGRFGFVAEIRSGDGLEGAVLAVRAGLLGRRIVLVPARDFDFVVPRAPAALAGFADQDDRHRAS